MSSKPIIVIFPIADLGGLGDLGGRQANAGRKHFDNTLHRDCYRILMEYGFTPAITK